MEPAKWMYEQRARQQGFRRIAGIDEAGRGPLAGPVVAACCILNDKLVLPEIDDCKKLTPNAREEIFEELTKRRDVVYGVGVIDVDVIDKVNIYQATILAMHQAVSSMERVPDYLLVDGLALPLPESPSSNVPWHGIPREKVVKGDTLSYSIGAASIIAKCVRDAIMKKMGEEIPHYGFEAHKGYATKKHFEAIEKYGPSKYHRKSFAPFKQGSPA